MKERSTRSRSAGCSPGGTVRWVCRAAALGLVSLLLAGCAGLRPATPEPAAPQPGGPAAEVDALFAELDRGDSPGVAAMVIRDGQVLHQRGYGLADLESGRPITPRTVFRLASVSKQFTAMAVMLLAAQGVLGYDDPVVRYVPELSRFGEGLTIRQLLHHTGGLPDYYDALTEAGDGPMPTNESAAAFLAGWGEALFPPGERYEYSNPGYEMLSLLVERVTGQRFGDFLEERIFAPLGMRDTVVFDQTEPEMAERAYGYSRTEEGYEPNDAHRLNHIVGSGGVYSSLRDLYLWDQALYTERLVPRAALEEAWRPARFGTGGEHPYGFGWVLGSYGPLGRRLAHAGGWVGFSTQIVRFSERRFTVILLSNLGDFGIGRYADRITDIYHPTMLIAGATLIDGSGGGRRRADVRIAGGRVAGLGELEPLPDEPVLDAAGLVLAPGFIDAHSHADAAIFDHRAALAAVSQGITTAVAGQDGSSQLPLRDFFARLEEKPAAVNLASFAGHGTLRREVLGEDFKREASAEEIESMAALLEREMEAGALGLSTGLEYDPGIYASTHEVVALARLAGARGGRYISHVRSEDRRFWEAIEEAIGIGRVAELPVQISHLKLALGSLHAETGRLLAMLDRARAEGIEVTADLYPYTYWQSTLTVIFPDRDYEDREAARFAVEELSTPEQMVVSRFDPEPDLAGRTLAEIAALRGLDPATALIELIREAEQMRAARAKPEPGEEGDNEVESVIAVSMTEADIERLMAWPHSVFCTDGELEGAHPRGYGSFPRILGRYVRERGVLGLEEAVHRMTAQAAAQLGLPERGTIEPGRPADLVLFDPDTILDRATLEEPHAPAAGVAAVWVNGELVYENGRETGRRPGRALRRGAPGTEE